MKLLVLGTMLMGLSTMAGAFEPTCLALCSYNFANEIKTVNVTSILSCSGFRCGLGGLIDDCNDRAKNANGTDPVVYTSGVEVKGKIFYSFDVNQACLLQKK